MKSRTAFINKKKGLTKGFTLVEIIVIIALITIVFSVGAFANVNLFTRQISISEESTLVGVLQKARSRAMNNIDASPHGVYVKNGEMCYILFEGNSYTPGPSDFCDPVGNSQFIQREDKVEVNMGGIEEFEIVFKQLSGNTEDDGTISLLDTVGHTEEIVISLNGLINW